MVLSRLFGCIPDRALQILNTLDPIKQEHVVWNGLVAMERVASSVVLRDEEAWLSVVSALVERRKRLGLGKYVFCPMVTTDSQKRRFQTTCSNILATLGKRGQSEADPARA